MAIATDYGPLDEPDECDHPSHCDREAVAQVPSPNVLGGFRFCDFHLALWADTKGDWTTLQELEMQRLAADDRFIRLEGALSEVGAAVILLGIIVLGAVLWRRASAPNTEVTIDSGGSDK